MFQYLINNFVNIWGIGHKSFDKSFLCLVGFFFLDSFFTKNKKYAESSFIMDSILINSAIEIYCEI